MIFVYVFVAHKGSFGLLKKRKIKETKRKKKKRREKTERTSL